jgi:hypothetical protein
MVARKMAAIIGEHSGELVSMLGADVCQVLT